MLSNAINFSGWTRLRRSFAVLLAVSFLACAGSAVLAQTGGEGALEGTVTDSTGAAIPNATVTATNQASKVSTTRKSTGAGLYSITPLIPGVYTVTVTVPGFATLTQKNLEVNGLNVTGFNPKLSPGAVDQAVTVTEAPPQLETSSASVSEVITNDVYMSLPLIMNGQQRDPSSLATLSVGAQSGVRAPIFSGTGDYLAEVYLNGIPTTTSNQQGDNRIIANSVPVESVDQLQIISSAPSAEYQGAGAIGFTVKSGGNQYHGEVIDLIRNTAFDAWGFAGNQLTKYAIVNGVATQVPAGKAAEHQNELSASVGGPVPFMHHKLFFFANYDRFHNTSTGNAAVFTVPTPLMKQGDFTELTCGSGGCTGSGSNNPPVIFNPLTNSCSGNVCTRQPFQAVKNGVLTNNVIPASYISPISQYEQKLLPNPNLPGLSGNYLTSGYSGYDNWEIVAKVDYDLTPKQRISVSYTRGLRRSIGFGSVMPLPYSTAISSILHPTMATVEHAWTLSPHIVNQFNYGFTRFGGVSLNASQGLKGMNAVDAGITGLPVGQATTEFPGSTFNSSPAFSSVTDTNWGATGGSQRSSSTVPTTFTIVDNLQWSVGHHNITFGVQTQWLEDNVISPLGTSDVYIQKWSPNDTANYGQNSSAISTSTTGYSYASFLLGAVNSSSAGVPLYSDIGGRYHPVSPYVQDNWQIRPNLTLNLGLRWDYLPPYHEVADRWSFFNPNATDPLTGSPGELEYAGNRGADISCQCRTPVHTYWKNWGPRLGLEYSPDPKTVFRAGFAVAYSRAGGVGGRAGDATGTGQTGFGSSIILPAATTSTASAGPSFYLNNSTAFQAAGVANTNFGGPGYTIPAPTGASASELTVGTGNYVNSSGKYVSAGGAPDYADPYLSGRAPEFIFYNFGMQKALTNAMTLTLNYSGSQSHFVAGAGEPGFWSGSMDPKYLVTLGSVTVPKSFANIMTAPATSANVAVAHAADSSVNAPYPGYTAAAALSTSASIGRMLRPFPQYSSPPGTTWDNVGNLSYNAFEFTLKMREYKGVNFTVNYTYSKNLGDDGTVRSYYPVPAAASSSGVAMPGNNRMDRSITINDIPENLNVFGYGKLPFGRGHIGGDNWAVRNIAGGWELSGIYTYSSGKPLLVTGTGCNAPAQGTCMPDLAPGRDLGSARINGDYGSSGVTYANFSQKNYLDTSAFSALNVFPVGGTIPCASLGDTSFDAKYGKGVCGNAITKIGTAPRSSSYLRQPSRYNVDASLQRSFPISKERVKFVFRADCFNVLNNVTFSMAQTQTISVVNPSATSSFGRLTGYSSPRRFQFSGRIVF
ncbi:MAG TPA: carboxypeptidase regulatory-like domain-containing protein [Acidobacteriaceae bacterium]|nr:carboxypeptidase regulatory-like domain-containing protein [Acidobacteriaceae bacterium]